MTLSIFNLFNIGIGPSSSHTVGPMRAANFFIDKLKKHDLFNSIDGIRIELCGSLSLTGIGHGTPKAVIAGLFGERPETTTPEHIEACWSEVTERETIVLNAERPIAFRESTDLIFTHQALPYHPNGMIFFALKNGNVLYRKVFYSIGGGFIVGHKSAQENRLSTRADTIVPYPFQHASDLLALTRTHSKSISDIVWANECSFRDPERIDEKIKLIWDTMKSCMDKGLHTDGLLPGRMQVKRRAHSLYQRLINNPTQAIHDPLTVMDWVNLYALAVNEENAAGGRVVTAPTNGAAGIIPAVLRYHLDLGRGHGATDIKKFLLTAGAIGILYKQNASISGAEVGCQGEVGVACSMAAAGLTEVLGGTPEQVENAAEIGMEHNLGLTCDPVDGQVQIPCIERNAMASVKAINAARIALKGDGTHFVTLDQVMKTMKETGRDMQDKYKETAQGGLAVCITEC